MTPTPHTRQRSSSTASASRTPCETPATAPPPAAGAIFGRTESQPAAAARLTPHSLTSHFPPPRRRAPHPGALLRPGAQPHGGGAVLPTHGRQFSVETALRPGRSLKARSERPVDPPLHPRPLRSPRCPLLQHDRCRRPAQPVPRRARRAGRARWDTARQAYNLDVEQDARADRTARRRARRASRRGVRRASAASRSLRSARATTPSRSARSRT